MTDNLELILPRDFEAAAWTTPAQSLDGGSWKLCRRLPAIGEWMMTYPRLIETTHAALAVIQSVVLIEAILPPPTLGI